MSVPPPPPRRRNAPDGSPPAPPPVNREARAARRAEERGSSRKKTVLMIGGSLAAVAVIAVVAIALMGGSDKKEGPEFKESTFVDLKVGPVDVASVNPNLGQPQNFPKELQDLLIARIGAYVDDGIVIPLREGKADSTKLAEVFDQPALARLGTAEGAALLDQGLPKAVGEVKIEAPPIEMFGLSSDNGNMLLVTVTIDFQVTAETKTGDVQIRRSGTLVFARDLEDNWNITGWTLHVDRSGAGVVTTTTAPAATTTTAGT
jgi:hypothetical protein